MLNRGRNFGTVQGLSSTSLVQKEVHNVGEDNQAEIQIEWATLLEAILRLCVDTSEAQDLHTIL